MSNYRLLQNGVLGSLTACPTCPIPITVLYSTPTASQGLLNGCCNNGGGGSPPYTITVWIAEGETYQSASQFYTDDTLSQTVANGYYMTTGAVGNRSYRQKISQTGPNNFTALTACSNCP